MDPWTVAHEWTVGQYDFNRAILAIARQEEERRAKAEEAKSRAAI